MIRIIKFFLKKNMFQIAIVVFREILEISLIIGILSAATKEISGRGKWIIGGLTLGAIISITLAFFTDTISESLDGAGQEFFNGLILLSAAFMISWTVIWMQKHAKSLSGELKKLSNSVKSGKKPLYALLIVVLLSSLREGLEIVLFTYSYYISGTPITNVILGLIIGALSGGLIGFLLYLGILKAFGKYFFTVTTWLLVFLSSGIAAQGVGFWVNANLLPALKNPLFDLSDFLPQTELVGRLLNIFLGYMDKPSGMQVIFYLSNLIILTAGLKIAKKI